MRKTLATIIASLALIVASAPFAAAGTPDDPAPTSSPAKFTDAACSAVVDDLSHQLSLAAEAQRTLVAAVEARDEKIDRQRLRIELLRAKVARLRSHR